MDINTIKLLAIMAAMAMFVMLWEIVTSLDGPNAEQEHMSESVRNRAKNAKYRGGVKTFDTPHWRGELIAMQQRGARKSCTVYVTFSLTIDSGPSSRRLSTML